MPKGMTSAQYMRERRAEFRARGGCSECGRPTMPGKTMCKEHAQYGLMQGKKRKEKLKAAGLCVICGKRPPEEGKNLCGECAERSKARFRAWYAKQKEKTAWKR